MRKRVQCCSPRTYPFMDVLQSGPSSYLLGNPALDLILSVLSLSLLLSGALGCWESTVMENVRDLGEEIWLPTVLLSMSASDFLSPCDGYIASEFLPFPPLNLLFSSIIRGKKHSATLRGRIPSSQQHETRKHKTSLLPATCSLIIRMLQILTTAPQRQGMP